MYDSGPFNNLDRVPRLNEPKFKLLFVNLQGQKNKTESLEVIQATENYTVICTAEHWLTTDEIDLWVPEGLILANKYCRKQHIHGGVSIFVAEDTNFKCLDLSKHIIEIDFEVTGIELIDFNTIVISLYRSPQGRTDTFLQSLDCLLKYLVGYKNGPNIVISGDVNSDFDVNTTKSTVYNFCNILRQYGLYCANNKPTRGESCLDNILTDISPQLYNLEVIDTNLADHDGLHFEVGLCSINTGKPATNEIGAKTRVMAKKNIESFKSLLVYEDWSNILACASAEECFDMFFNRLLVLFDVCFPVRELRTNNQRTKRDKPKLASGLNWYTPELQVMKNCSLICKDMYNREKSMRLFTMLKSLKSQYRSALRQAKKLKNEEMIEKSTNKCKTAWTIINKAAGKNKHSGIQTNSTPDDFNQYFVTSVEDISAKVNSSTIGAGQCLQKVNLVKPDTGCVFSTVETDQVLSIVMSLKNSTTKDVYGMSSNLLKEIVFIILRPLTFCINKCIMEGVFPKCLKFSRVVPILKKGNADEPSNYRPISCIPTVAKVFEKILKAQVCNYFELYNLFSVSQFAYRTGKSAVQAIDDLVQQLLSALENKNSAQVTLCDLSRAFDTVQHDILLDKLSFYGFKGNDLAIFNSYLTGRTQLVDVNGLQSHVLNVKLGVPQGSVLGPILFLVLVNDLSFNVSNCFTTLYADDTSLLTSHKDLDELTILAESGLSDAIKWFETNGLFLNVDKTQNLLVSLKNNVRNHANVKLLGISIDSSLTWKTHVDNTCKRLSRVIFLLVNLKRQVTFKYLKNCYYAFFESIMRYGLIIWGNSVDIDKILLIQKKALRIITGSDYLEHCKPLFIETGILTVINLYIFDVLTMVKKNVVCLSHRNDIHDHLTRKRNELELPRYRLSKSMHYHRYLGIKMYNKLPSSMKQLTDKKFSTVLYEWLSKNPFYSIDELLTCDLE